jgi:hypothetical protein
MGVSGQRHARAALHSQEKGPPVPNVQEAGWASVLVSRLDEKSFVSAGDRTLVFCRGLVRRLIRPLYGLSYCNLYANSTLFILALKRFSVITNILSSVVVIVFVISHLKYASPHEGQATFSVWGRVISDNLRVSLIGTSHTFHWTRTFFTMFRRAYYCTSNRIPPSQPMLQYVYSSIHALVFPVGCSIQASLLTFCILLSLPTLLLMPSISSS